jgi:hypothetical protein
MTSSDGERVNGFENGFLRTSRRYEKFNLKVMRLEHSQ